MLQVQSTDDTRIGQSLRGNKNRKGTKGENMHACMCVSQDARQCDGTAAETHTIMYQMKVTLALQGSSRCLWRGYETIS